MQCISFENVPVEMISLNCVDAIVVQNVRFAGKREVVCFVVINGSPNDNRCREKFIVIIIIFKTNEGKPMGRGILHREDAGRTEQREKIREGVAHFTAE